MTPLDAVAAAIRERLLAGQPAPLLGLGTLVRQHVAARVEERADGARVMLPPGETIGLDATAPAEPSLSRPFARLLALSPDAADRAYADAIDQIEARLAATGEVRLPGVGLLRRTSGGVVLGVEAELLAAVNRRYEGLTPVPAEPPRPPHPPAPPEAEPPPEADAQATPPDPADEPSEPEERAPHDILDDGAPEDEGLVGETADGEATDGESLGDEATDDVASEGEALSPTDPFGEPEEPADAPATPPDTLGGPLRHLSSTGSPDGFAPLAEADPEPADDWGPPPPDWPSPPIEVVPPSDDPAVEEADDDSAPETIVAAPFGDPDGPLLSDVLAATPEDRQPPSDEAWADETWTAPDVGTAFSAPADPFVDTDTLDAVIEDADFDVVDASVEPAASSFFTETGFPPVPTEADAPALPHVVVPTDRPSLGVDPPAAVEAPAAVAPPASAPDAAVAGRAGLWWLLVALVLAALVAAAVWFWPQLSAALRGEPPPSETITVEAEPGPRPIPALVPTPDGDPGPAGADRGEDDGDPAVEAARPAPSTAAPAQPRTYDLPSTPRTDQAFGGAVLPPRVSGLSPADVRALAGRTEPITPRTDAWTLVVSSTSSRAAAEAQHDLYRRAGYRTAVLTSRSGQFRVAVGLFPTRADAVRLLDRLPPQAPADTWPLNLQTL